MAQKKAAAGGYPAARGEGGYPSMRYCGAVSRVVHSPDQDAELGPEWQEAPTKEWVAANQQFLHGDQYVKPT